MIRHVGWLVVVSLTLLMACTQSKPTPSLSHTPPPTEVSVGKVPKNWHIELTLSGGLAGLRRAIELASTGELTVTDQKLNKQVEVQVPQAELTRITTLLVQASLSQSPRRPQTCPDCFQYDLAVRMDGQQFFTQINDATLAESGLESLIRALVSLQEQALSGQFNP